MGYHLLAISAASKNRQVQLSSLGCLRSVSITSWLYSPVVCASTTRIQQSSDTPAGHEVLWKVPMQLIFRLLHLQTKRLQLLPHLSKVLFRRQLPSGHRLLLNHSFILNTFQTQRMGGFPLPSPYSEGSAYAKCTSPSSLALPWQGCRQPKASQAPEPAQTSSTPSFHHYPPSLIAASSG